MRLFEYSNNYRKLEFNKILEAFRPNSFVERCERIKKMPLFDDR